MNELLRLEPGLRGRVRVGVCTIDDVAVVAEDARLAAEVDALCQELASRHAGEASLAVPGVAEARSLYKAIGLDPTKVRPSNEALLRRALKGETLYRVNNLVDALNLCSLRQQLPYGLYDLARVGLPVVLRLGLDGEGYEGIRKGWINLERRPLLADAEGPFGNPSADSLRTSIRLDTTRILVVAYAPAGMSEATLGQRIEDTAATLVRFCGGKASAGSQVG